MATLDNSQSITALYIAAFGRAPDKGGLAYWTAQMEAGLSFDSVISSFLNSQEATSLVGQGVSDQAFLSTLYSNVLSRAPDTGGAQYWQGRLDNLEDRAALVKEYISSISDSTGDDTKLLQNKIVIGQKFAASASGDNTIYAKVMMTYVTSETDALTTGQALNDYFDNGAPATGGGSSYGNDFKLEFGYVGNFFISSTVTAGAGVEEPNLAGMSIDIGEGTIKITSESGSGFFANGVTLKISDANGTLPAFTGFNIISNTWTVNPSADFDPSNISVTADAVTITLTGLNVGANTSLEFSLLS